MKINDHYTKQISMAETVFDMAAVCYRILEDEVDNPIVFVSRYVDESAVECQENPNFDTLLRFSDFISKTLEKYSETDFVRNRDSIIWEILKMDLKPFLNEKENQLSVIFTLLSTIDSLVPFWENAIIRERGTLNKGASTTTHLVYLSCRKYIHEALIQKIGRERKSCGGIGETLNNLLFLKRDMLPKGAMAPEICFMLRDVKKCPACLKVAVIVGIQGTHFTTENIGGSAKVIKYKPEMQIRTAEKIWEKISTAIRDGAEFILLPEFCTSKEILEFIQKKLSEYMLQKRSVSKLIAVFPGSTWTQSDDNVQFILDAYGREIGRYYKNTPFRKKKSSKTGYQRCEGLNHLGLRTCLLRIEGIGYLLPATCRDVIDGNYTKYLIQNFAPSFLFIPAWSSSGNSFERPLKGFAADYFVNSVLCNGCGALSNKSSVMGGMVIPCKKTTVASGHFEKIQITEAMAASCHEGCEEMCSYIMEIDFNTTPISRQITCCQY